MLDATLKKVAEARTRVGDAKRQVGEIADAAGQLESRSRYARAALMDGLTESGMRNTLEAIASHCPSPQTIQSWRENAETELAAVGEQLQEIHEEIDKVSEFLKMTRVNEPY